MKKYFFFNHLKDLICVFKKHRSTILFFLILTFVGNLNSYSQAFEIKSFKAGGLPKVKRNGNALISDSLIAITIDINTKQPYPVNYQVKVIEDNEQTKTYKAIWPDNMNINSQQDIFFYLYKQKKFLKMETKNKYTNSVFDIEYFF